MSTGPHQDSPRPGPPSPTTAAQAPPLPRPQQDVRTYYALSLPPSPRTSPEFIESNFVTDPPPPPPLHFQQVRISPEVAHFLEEFWEMLAFIGNTVVFVIAGLVISYQLQFDHFTMFDVRARLNIVMPLFRGLPPPPLVAPNPSHRPLPLDPHMSPLTQRPLCLIQVGVLLLLYFGSTIVRGSIVSLVWLAESALGRKMDWRDAVVTTWGGLRGAVGLALAMIVYYDTTSICQHVRDVVLFHTSGIVVLTVVVNSMSMKKVIALLGINEETPEKALMQRQGARRLTTALPRTPSNTALALTLAPILALTLALTSHSPPPQLSSGSSRSPPPRRAASSVPISTRLSCGTMRSATTTRSSPRSATTQRASTPTAAGGWLATAPEARWTPTPSAHSSSRSPTRTAHRISTSRSSSRRRACST